MRRAHWVLLIALAFALFPLLLRHAPLLDDLERWSYDLRMRWAASHDAHVPGIALVLIDNDTIVEYRDVQSRKMMWWPFLRQAYQLVLDYLAQSGARAVVFDIDFSEGTREDEPDQGLRWFAGSLASSPSVLAVNLQQRQPGPGTPTYGPPERISPVVQPAFDAARLGFVNARVDPDGKVRRTQLLAEVEGRTIPSLAMAGAMVAFPDRELRVEREQILFGSSRLPVDDLGDFLIRFHREQDFDRYSFGAVFEAALAAGLPANAEEDSKVKISFGGKPVTGAEFKDKIVLIGSTATGLMDLKPTSLGDVYPGVLVHASLLDDIVNGNVLRPVSGAWNAVIAGALGAAMSLAVLWRRLGRVARPAAIFGPPLILIVLAFHLFAARGLVLALGLPLATAAVAYALSYTGAYLVENRRARSITSLFQHYVPATVVRTLVENPRRVNLLGERRLITVFFSDIAGFTEISNRAVFREDPSRLTAHLNDYLTQVTEVLHRHGATLDKYIGDAVVAFFNAPLFQDDHASAACLAALECQEVIGRFNERARATAMPEFRTRIGLCTGPVTVGNVGSRLRYNYTAIGQTVNLGARLEACNKIYGTGILAGETTATLAGDGLVVREVDYVRVPGIVEEAAPLRLFEIVGARGKVDGGVLERRERFLAALALYRRKEFAAARRGFEDLARHGDSVSRVYVGRCEEFERAPPTGELVHEIHSK